MMTSNYKLLSSVAFTVCVAIAAYYFDVPSSVAAGVNVDNAVSWLGLVITVFSLVIALFLAIVAIEAYSHVSSLRALEEKYRVASDKFSANQVRYASITEAISNYSRDVLEITTNYMMKLDAPDGVKDDFSVRYAVLRSKLEISLLPPENGASLDKIISHVLVIVEGGVSSDLRFALDALQRVDDRQAAYPLIGEVLRRMKNKTSAVS